MSFEDGKYMERIRSGFAVPFFIKNIDIKKKAFSAECQKRLIALILLEPARGFEPRTFSLRVRFCS